MKYEGDIKTLKGIVGIYKIICLANGRFCIGSSRNLCNRYREHRGDLRRKSHKTIRMQSSWNKYGETMFTFSEKSINSKRASYMETDANLMDGV